MNNPTAEIVFVIDDDPAIRKSMKRSLEKRGLSVQTYDSGESFLADFNHQGRGCIIVDLSMPGMNGLEVQNTLNKLEIELPIIFITGHGGIADSVKALKAGAIDFLEKPFRPQLLIDRIEEALTQSQRTAAKKEQIQRDTDRLEKLTSREREILRLLISTPTPPSSKELARLLEISHRTVEHHRARILEKTDSRSIQELYALGLRIGQI